LNSSPIKPSEEIEKKLEQKTDYSPEYRLKKFNNYDNTVRNADRIVLENYDIQRYFDNKVATTKRSNSISVPNNNVTLGSSMGPGGRAVLYALIPKSKETRNQELTETNYKEGISDKIKFREAQSTLLKKWNHFDSNISNRLNIEKKILASKNYELDSRANSIKDYGF
jgi:hypothetical protein